MSDTNELKPRRIYMDNACTSFPKPPAVLRAMVRYASEIGAGAARGGYAEGAEAAAIVAECRRRLNQLFNGEGAERFIFTLNCTDALNAALKGLIDPGVRGHAVCSAIDHNSVLRPLAAMEAAGRIEVTRVPIDGKTGLIDPQDVGRAIRPDTRLIALTQVSNVTGTIQPLRAISTIAKEHGVPVVVDAAQSAGKLPIDLKADGIDLLAVPGHKGLMGPFGTGCLYVGMGMEKILRPLREGGTGLDGLTEMQPDNLPEKYESGSHNVGGIAGLSEGIGWVLEQTVERLARQEKDLVRAFLDGFEALEEVRIIGPQGVRDRVGIFSVRVRGMEAKEVAKELEAEYGILAGAGYQSAPWRHRALGTAEAGGTARVSFGPFLTALDVNYAADALAHIAQKRA